ncbi:hypothetical protein PPACK8108_LOCUS12713 [Phakopsora pachyrhizi]|uniref:Uncharacterized protein n=1 Tax=Phakopsora pachyrhizi TaxID=170000 RepID=A0AAV0B3P9_PHAPC|nr:hypothetical protein PPACK8108_LOCUS12713 [Phakopsora pachyrhizi]
MWHAVQRRFKVLLNWILPAHLSLYCDPMHLASQRQRERQLGVLRANQMMANTLLAANTLSTSSNYSILQIVSGQVSTRTSDVQKCNIASTSYHGLPPIVGPKIQPSDPSSPSGWDMVTRWARLGTFLDELETRSAKLQEQAQRWTELLQDQLEYALSGIVHKQKSGKEQKSKATEHHESAIQAQGKYEKE